jgi:hypothetical protein
MVNGQMVTVELYGGELAQRRVIADRGKVVVICAEEEYVSAKREGRDPEGVGFPRENVLKLVEV